MEQYEARVERFTALFERHYDAVVRYAERRTEPASAADVAAEVFLVSWRRLEEIPADPLPWLLVTARQILSNHRRGENRATSLRVRLASERDQVSDPSASVVEDLATRRRWADAFGRLRPDEQEAIALSAWDGLTAAQAAKVLGCGVSAYVMRLHRARKRLRRILDEEKSSRATTRRWSPQIQPRGPE